MKTVVFQGDSITDGQWSRLNPGKGYLGYRYPTLVQGELNAKYPGEYTFINRAGAGERSVDMLRRVKSDVIGLRPDIVSLLCGVNDYWDEMLTDTGLSAQKYGAVLDIMLRQIGEALPQVRFIVLTPAVFSGSATCSDDLHPGRWEAFRAAMEERNRITREIAGKYGAVIRDLQPLFDEQLKKAPASCWIADGVHPTAAGDGIIKAAWIDAFNEIENRNK